MRAKCQRRTVPAHPAPTGGGQQPSQGHCGAAIGTPRFLQRTPAQRQEQEEEELQDKGTVQRQEGTEEEELQTKLKVDGTDSAPERAADRMADRVLRMPEPVQRQPLEEEEEEEEELQPRADPTLQRQEQEEEEELLQPRGERAGGAAGAAAPSVEGSIRSARGGGEPLPGPTRGYFEPRFGRDFDAVRVHADGRAAEASRQLRAQAFTSGSDVFFAAGRYAPESHAGKRLLAHELAHVVQQGRAGELWRKPAAPASRPWGRPPLLAHTPLGELTVQAKKLDPAAAKAGGGKAMGGGGKAGGGGAKAGGPVAKGGGGAAAKGADAKEDQARKDYTKFVASNYRYPNFRVGLNGRFDVDYHPSGNVMNVDMKVKFQFVDDALTFFERYGIGGAARRARHRTLRRNYIRQVTQGWSRRYAFQNVREPQAVWGKLTPTQVQLNVREVDAGQHFTVNIWQKSSGTAQVHRGVTKLYKEDLAPQEKFNPGTRLGEMLRANRINPAPILFESNSAKVSNDDKKKLAFLGTYLRRINEPKFDVEVVGHASSEGSEEHNQKLSEERAHEVAAPLLGPGLANHNVGVWGEGETGATEDPLWRIVEVRVNVPKAWKNMQDVTVHEFGHMIGLGDEYGGSSPTATHYDLVKKAFGEDYAKQVAKRGDTDYASIMEGGSDVRIQHYVTFWSALCQTTMTKAKVPTPRLGYADWKFIG